MFGREWPSESRQATVVEIVGPIVVATLFDSRVCKLPTLAADDEYTLAGLVDSVNRLLALDGNFESVSNTFMRSVVVEVVSYFD